MIKSDFLFFLLLALLLAACFNSENSTTTAIKMDTVPLSVTQLKDTLAVDIKGSIALPVSQSKENIDEKKQNPFSELSYSKVIAYDFNGGKSNIITNGKLSPTVEQQKELRENQIDDLTNYLADSSTYGGPISDCFEPHLGLVFYKKNRAVAHISICLKCNYLRSSIPIPAMGVYQSSGFSALGRKKINALCKQLNFSHCVNKM